MKYINNEEFSLGENEIEEITMSDEEINDKYKRGEIRIITEQARYPVKNIKIMIDSGDYLLNPEYQRRKRWNNVKKSRLIESFIMNVPLPPIFLYEVDYAKYEVMDGLQRLTSIYDYYDGKYKLEGLEYWKELNGKGYNDLPIEIKKGIDRRYVSSIVLLEETAKTKKEAEELKQIVFERLNSGGEKLKPQETRNALYNGEFNQLCIKLAENEKFKKMWRIPISQDEYELLNNDIYRTMEDVEIVLRFFAFRWLDLYNKVNISIFLDEYLKQANKFESETIKELEKLFEDVIDLTYEIFGEDAFLLPMIERQSTKPTKTIYDSLLQAILLNLEDKDVLLKNKDLIKENKYSDRESLIFDNDKKLFDGKYNHASIIAKRIEYFNKMLERFKSN